MEQVKNTFFNRLKISIKDIDKYDVFAGDKVKKSVIYISKLLAIVMIIVSIFYTYKFYSDITRVENYEEFLESFELPEEMKKDAIYVMENTETSKLMVVYFITTFVMNYGIHFIITMLDIILLMLLAYVSTMFSRIMFKPSVLFNISASAITLSVIIKGIYFIINILNGFTIKYFDLMYTSVAYIYTIAAILIIKSELIKNEQELMQIMAEQENARKKFEKGQDLKQEKNKTEEDNLNQEDKLQKKNNEDE